MLLERSSLFPTEIIMRRIDLKLFSRFKQCNGSLIMSIPEKALHGGEEFHHTLVLYDLKNNEFLKGRKGKQEI
jgi:hypothetical protein